MVLVKHDPPPSGEEVSGVQLQSAGLRGALPESVPAAEERHGGAVRTADRLRPRPPARFLRRPAAALHPQSHARKSRRGPNKSGSTRVDQHGVSLKCFYMQLNVFFPSLNLFYFMMSSHMTGSALSYTFISKMNFILSWT